jgi:hypothetical protein
VRSFEETCAIVPDVGILSAAEIPVVNTRLEAAFTGSQDGRCYEERQGAGPA